jgi:ribosome-associated toxin RatA of RatAB toxin-antitoxin module
MATVRKSVIVPHSCGTMFDLVDRVEDYPRFLPWCRSVQVVERTEAVTSAFLGVEFHGLATRIATRNAKVRPGRMDLAFVDGPFESFAGSWTFAPLGESGCRVEFALDYELARGPLAGLLAPVLGQIMETLVDRFVERAAQEAKG